MKRNLRLKDNEPLYLWVERIVDHYKLSDEVKGVLREISVKSYIQGSNAAFSTTQISKDKGNEIKHLLAQISRITDNIKDLLDNG